ncbi:MAG: hypothetical protein R6X08_12455 [Desulfosalsimonadaceae bacterium]
MAEKPENRKSMRGLMRLAGCQKGKLALSGLLAAVGQGLGNVPFFLVYRIVAGFGANPLDEEVIAAAQAAGCHEFSVVSTFAGN